MDHRLFQWQWLPGTYPTLGGANNNYNARELCEPGVQTGHRGVIFPCSSVFAAPLEDTDGWRQAHCTHHSTDGTTSRGLCPWWLQGGRSLTCQFQARQECHVRECEWHGRGCAVFLKNSFIFQWQLTCNVILVSGVQHSDEAFMERMKWSPRQSSTRLTPFRVVTIVVTVFSIPYIPMTAA